MVPRRGTGTSFDRADSAGVRTWWPQEVTVSLQEGRLGCEEQEQRLYSTVNKQKNLDVKRVNTAVNALPCHRCVWKVQTTWWEGAEVQSHTGGTVRDCAPKPLLIGCEKKTGITREAACNSLEQNLCLQHRE